MTGIEYAVVLFGCINIILLFIVLFLIKAQTDIMKVVNYHEGMINIIENYIEEIERIENDNLEK